MQVMLDELSFAYCVGCSQAIWSTWTKFPTDHVEGTSTKGYVPNGKKEVAQIWICMHQTSSWAVS